MSQALENPKAPEEQGMLCPAAELRPSKLKVDTSSDTIGLKKSSFCSNQTVDGLAATIQGLQRSNHEKSLSNLSNYQESASLKRSFGNSYFP